MQLKWTYFVQTFIRFLVLATISITVLCSINLLRKPELLPIKIVRISGMFEHTPHDSIEKAYSPFLQSGFLNIDIQTLQQTLLQFPWIAKVSINRLWPDTLEILLNEEEAVARWNKNQLVTKNGRVFTPPASTIPEGLPDLIGPAERVEDVIQQYELVKSIMKPTGSSVSLLSIDHREGWELELNGKVNVKLGRVEPIERLKKFVSKYQYIIGKKIVNATSIDLRYANGLAINWDNSKTV